MIEIKTLKTIKLLDILYELQEAEWGKLNLDIPMRGQVKHLPGGREDIFQRLWAEIIKDQYGNQQFNNDSFYRVSFEDAWDPDLSQDMQVLKEHCKDALNPDCCGHSFLLFDVCW